MSFANQENLATPQQAKDLLDQIDAVTTRGEPLMDRFFFVGTTDAIPERIANIFPAPENPHDRIEYAYLFAHLFNASNLATGDMAGMLTLSRHEYHDEVLTYVSSAIYKIVVNGRQYNLEQEIDYSSGSHEGRIFRDDETEAIAAYETQLAQEAQARREAYHTERSLGFLAVSSAIADDLITFAKQFNPHLA